MSYSIETRDGIVIRNIPDDIPPDATELKHRVASERAKLKPETASKPAGGFTDYFGPAEAALSLGTSAVGGLVGQIAGVGRTLTGGKFGTQEGIRQGQDTASSVSDAIAYRPRTQLGQDIVIGVGGMLSDSKLAGIGPTEAVAGGILAGPAIRQAGATARNVQIPSMLRTPEPQMVGMGAAETSIPVMRIERASSLPVPIQLTKGQATREFGQQQFERETAKNPTSGEPLRQRFADQNVKMQQNLDAFYDMTGAEAGSLRSAGQAVSDTVMAKAKKVKGQVDAAYEAARKNGELQEPINVGPLQQYLENKQPQAINAPVLASTLADISAISKRTGGAISINDLEEIRKGVVAAGRKDATNGHYAKDINKLIDTLTEGKGGTEYQYARRLRTRFANEFENVGVIDKLMSTKPGTIDRSVAYEDVFSHTILKGSLDDVRAVRKTLQTTGPQGEQAWRELQGQTIKHLKDEVTKNAQKDINGNRIVSPAQLDRIVTELDKDGKLDFIFGKQGAQKIRDVNELSLEAFTSPPGSVNTSNSASALLAALDMVAGMSVTGLPIPAAHAIKYGVNKIQSNALDKKVNQALNPQQGYQVKRK